MPAALRCRKTRVSAQIVTYLRFRLRNGTEKIKKFVALEFADTHSAFLVDWGLLVCF